MRRAGRLLLLVAVGWAVGTSTGLWAERLGFTPREALLVSVPLSVVLSVWYLSGPKHPGVQ